MVTQWFAKPSSVKSSAGSSPVLAAKERIYMNVTTTVSATLWKIIHEVFATDHFEFGSTIVQADSANEAFKLFNKCISDNHYIKKAKSIEDVRPLIYYKKKD